MVENKQDPLKKNVEFYSNNKPLINEVTEYFREENRRYINYLLIGNSVGLLSYLEVLSRVTPIGLNILTYISIFSFVFGLSVTVVAIFLLHSTLARLIFGFHKGEEASHALFVAMKKIEEQKAKSKQISDAELKKLLELTIKKTTSAKKVFEGSKLTFWTNFNFQEKFINNIWTVHYLGFAAFLMGLWTGVFSIFI